MSMIFEPLGQPFGAIGRGWNPAAALSAEDKDSILKALTDYQVLIFRGHHSPTDAQLAGFARHFGELIKGSVFFGDNQNFPEILRVNNLKDEKGFPLGTGGAEACDWHSDYSYLPRHGVISFLDAIQVPPTGGCTYFASTYNALESLPDREQQRLSGMTAYHDTLAADRNIRVEEAKQKETRAEVPKKPSARHPLLISNPDTGRQALYISPMLTRFVDGLSAEENHRFLEEMYARITNPDNVYGHDWQAGDLVMWDNIGLIHRRDGFDPHDTRSMRQLTTLSD